MNLFGDQVDYRLFTFGGKIADSIGSCLNARFVAPVNLCFLFFFRPGCDKRVICPQQFLHHLQTLLKGASHRLIVLLLSFK